MKWRTKLVPGTAPDGAPILSVLAKATWLTLHDERPLSMEALEFVEADVHWGTNNPATEPMQFESEAVAWKPCTDVVVIGNAISPRGKQARFFDGGIQIGNFRKAIRVLGNRKLKLKTFGFEFSDPELFETMPLHYGRAYGGRFQSSKIQSEMAYPRNPVGVGFVVNPTPEELVNTTLPNLENPAHLLTPDNLVLKTYEQWTQAPQPWSLGYTSRNFHPRVTLSGLPAELVPGAEITRLQTRTASEGQAGNTPTPVLNPDFHCGASEGLRLPFLKGDEAVTLGYMDLDHPMYRFPLPGVRPRVWVNVGMGAEWMDTVLQSVIITKGSNQVSMVWRGSCHYDGPESMSTWTDFKMGVEE